MLVKAPEYFEHFGEFLPLWRLHLFPLSHSSTLKGTFSKEGDEEGAWKNSQLISFVRSRLALRRRGGDKFLAAGDAHTHIFPSYLGRRIEKLLLFSPSLLGLVSCFSSRISYTVGGKIEV